MKNIFLVLGLLMSISSFSQIVTKRATGTTTVTDDRLMVLKNLVIPRYLDTTAANLDKGIDSCGAIIYTYGMGANKEWTRYCNPKRWAQMITIENIAANQIDTANRWYSYLYKKQGTDSVFGIKGTTLYFLYTVGDTGGGGVGDTSNYVTNVFVKSGAFTDTFFQRKSGVDSIYYVLYRPDKTARPGYVTWAGVGYNYNITAGLWPIGDQMVASPAGSFSLAAAHPTLYRIDLVYVNAAGQVMVRTGTAAPSPVEPLYDPTSEYKVTTITVYPNTTSPIGQVAKNVVYNENIEWVGSTGLVTANFNGTTTPYIGSKTTDVGTTVSGSHINYVSPAPFDVSNVNMLNMFIKLKSNLSAQKGMSVRLYNNNALVSTTQMLTIVYGLDPKNTSIYQNISIPLKDFNLSSSIITMVRIDFYGGTNGAYIDNIQFQGGIQQPDAGGYVLPTATRTIKGGVIIGSGLLIDANGVLSTEAGLFDLTPYRLIADTIGPSGTATISYVKRMKDSLLNVINTVEVNSIARDALKVDKTGTITINGDTKQFGINPVFTVAAPELDTTRPNGLKTIKMAALDSLKNAIALATKIDTSATITINGNPQKVKNNPVFNISLPVSPYKDDSAYIAVSQIGLHCYKQIRRNGTADTICFDQEIYGIDTTYRDGDSLRVVANDGRNWGIFLGGGGTADGNNYPMALGFTGGNLTLTRNGLSTLSQSLDGRYLQVTDTSLISSRLTLVQAAAGAKVDTTSNDFIYAPTYGFSTSATASVNTIALNSAIITAAALGKNVKTGPGLFLVNKINFHPNVSVIGAGIKNTILRSASAVPTFEYLNTVDVTQPSAGIFDMEIDGNNIGTIGINMRSVFHTQYTRLFIRNFTVNCFNGLGLVDNHFDKCWFQNAPVLVKLDRTISQSAGSEYNAQSNLNMFTECAFLNGTTWAVDWYNSAGAQFTNCDWELNGTSGNLNTGAVRTNSMSPNAEGTEIVVSGGWAERNYGTAFQLNPSTGATKSIFQNFFIQFPSAGTTKGIHINQVNTVSHKAFLLNSKIEGQTTDLHAENNGIIETLGSTYTTSTGPITNVLSGGSGGGGTIDTTADINWHKTTLASNGTQNINSPYVGLMANAWNASAVASQPVGLKLLMQGIAGTSPSATLSIQKSINGAAPTEIAYLTSGGSFYTGSITANNVTGLNGVSSNSVGAGILQNTANYDIGAVHQDFILGAQGAPASGAKPSQWSPKITLMGRGLNASSTSSLIYMGFNVRPLAGTTPLIGKWTMSSSANGSTWADNFSINSDNSITLFTATGEPPTPAAGTVIEWWDGTNKKWKKSDGSTGIIY